MGLSVLFGLSEILKNELPGYKDYGAKMAQIGKKSFV